MQEFSIVDENDVVVGKDTRQNIHKNGLLHREIHVWIFNEKGEVLLQKRSATKDTYPGFLDVSVGGHVEVGEDYLTTATRELTEETGLKAEPKDLIDLGVMRRTASDASTGMINNTIRHIFAFKYDGPVEKLKVEAGESTGFELWPISRIMNTGVGEKSKFVPLLVSGDINDIYEKILSLSKSIKNHDNMKSLIIYQSIHHGNTEKIAKKIAEVLGADLKKPNEVKPEDLANYDLVGFGSGIYFGKIHVSMLKFIESLPAMAGKRAFVFCTHGAGGKGFNKGVIRLLSEKGFNVVSEFECRGFDTFGPFKIFGGFAKGRPSEKDLTDAEFFGRKLLLKNK